VLPVTRPRIQLRGHRPDDSGQDPRGQSLVEFALLLPLLLIILLGVADFGRVFQAGIVMESATRAAAEAGALEYLRETSTGNAPDYSLIRERAAEVACEEAKLENVDTGNPDGTPYAHADHYPASPRTHCHEWPIIRVCVHDEAQGDVNCGQPESVGDAAVPGADCPSTDGGWNPQNQIDVLPTAANSTPSKAYVEVRTCYRFTTLIPVNDFLPIGEVFLQRRAIFTVADY
jgi:hypothetical protein